MENHSRGSEWNRWDLHIHTPYSVLNNQFGDDFDEYVKQLYTRAIDNNVVTIGITDYFSIDGYRKIVEEYRSFDKLEKLLESDELAQKAMDILLLPNIEFRLDIIIDGNKVNFHVIFSDEVSITDIEENFLNNVKFVKQGDPFNTGTTRTLTRNNITEFGNNLISEHSFSGDAYKVGVEQLVVNSEQIKELLDDVAFKNKYIIVTPVDEDLSKISWDSGAHSVRKTMIQKTQCFFSANQSTIDFGLGKKHESDELFINEFKSFKPSVHGSDAHMFDNMFKPDINRNCWIKAEATFNGLQQILFESEDRVRVTEIKPESKQDYYVIDKIEISNKDFSPDFIFLNNKLNCIIGGKSTGKSILLHNIARAVDNDQVKDKCEITQLKNYYEIGKDVNVYWADGEVSTLSSRSEEEHKIIYIPQTYLNKLSDEEEETTEIDSIIKDIVLLNDNANISFERSEKEIYDYKKDLDMDIYSFVCVCQSKISANAHGKCQHLLTPVFGW